MLKIEPTTGFGAREKLETENHKVFSACLLNSGIQGISMTLEPGAEQPTSQILILGCNRGFLLKYEKGMDEAAWTKTGECRLEQSIVDVLQIHPMTVLAVEEEGTFDVVDVTSM